MKLPRYEVVKTIYNSYIIIDSNEIHMTGSTIRCMGGKLCSTAFSGSIQHLERDFADVVCHNMNEAVKCVQEQYDAALSSILKDSKDR